MGENAKKIISVLVIVAVFIAVRFGIQAYNEQGAMAAAEDKIDQIRQRAAQNHPDMQTSEAMRQEAVAMASEKLNAETDQRKRLTTAASNFMGFYLINTRERAKYCLENGVDISPFVSAFEQGHAAEYAKARTALAGAPVTEDKLYAMLQPQLRPLIVQDMTDIASQNNVSIKGACELIADNGAALADQMHISKAQPVVYMALMEVK